MTRLTILVDMDGVLSDFVTAFMASYHRSGGIGEPTQPIKWGFIDELEDQGAVEAAWADARTWLGQTPYPGALEGLRRLYDAHSVYIVTDPGPRPDVAIVAKFQWLRVHVPWLSQRRIITTAKRELLRGDILIDDRADNVYDWLLANGDGVRCYTPLRPWNEGLICTFDGELDAIAADILDGLDG